MNGETRNLIYVCLTAIASLCYCYFIPANLPKGKLRLLSLVPVFGIFTLLPLQLSTVLLSALTAFFLTWFGNLKLLLFAFDSGPLLPKRSLPIFVTLAFLPIKVRTTDERAAVPCKRPKIPLNWAAKTFLLSVMITLNDYKDYMKPEMLRVLYSGVLYFFLDIVLGFFINAVHILFGFELEPSSDEPYLSTSLQDFWGKRWNLAVPDILHQAVYNPVRRILQPVLGKKWAALPAALAVFLLSGLMHELLFYYVIRVKPTWEVTWFFVVQGTCLALEVGIKAAVNGKWRLHPAVSGPMTMAFLVATGTWHYAQLIRNGAHIRVMEELEAINVIRFFVAITSVLRKIFIG